MVSTIYKVKVVLGFGSLYVAALVAQWWIFRAASGVFSVVDYASLSIVPLVVMLFKFPFDVVCIDVVRVVFFVIFGIGELE